MLLGTAAGALVVVATVWGLLMFARRRDRKRWERVRDEAFLEMTRRG